MPPVCRILVFWGNFACWNQSRGPGPIILKICVIDPIVSVSGLWTYIVKGRLLHAEYWKIFHQECSISSNKLFYLAPLVATRGYRFKILLTHSSL